MEHKNSEPSVIADFGREWETYGQEKLVKAELELAFSEYFHIFPFDAVDSEAEGFDMGCGSGRWAKMIAPKVGKLNCIDPSDMALGQAQKNLSHLSNVTFECAAVDGTKLAEGSQDFGYCLGVLHHIPYTDEGLKSCVRLLKPGAPFLVYLYYRFDNRPAWFGSIWRTTDVARRFISSLPFPIKLFVSKFIAVTVYYPLAKLSLVLEKLGFSVDNIPLSTYRDKSYYFMRTDSLDRFGTRLEKRFTKVEIEAMMKAAGLGDVSFSERAPHWVAIGYKK